MAWRGVALVSDDPATGPLLSVRPHDLVWHEWAGDPQVCVFDKASGMTHLLNALPTEILRSLSAQALRSGQLCTQLATLAEVPASPEWCRAVAESVVALHALGLVSYRPGR